MAKDLRHFLYVVKAKAPELLLRIPKTVDPQWEMSAVQKKLEAEDKLPVPVFEKGRGLLSTCLGIDATRPLDPSFPEVAEPPRSVWSHLDVRAYLA